MFDLKSTLQSDEVMTSPVLVVPPGTRGAWSALRAAIKPGQRYQNFLVVGSAGIGKSRTINYFIREFILERRQDTSQPLPVVLFEHRKDGRVWQFSPNDASDHMSEYKAVSMLTCEFAAGRVDALKNPNNLYVVDSGKAEESKDPTFVPAVCVYVCSPDTRHFSEWSKHLQRGGRFNIPMWSLEALEAASFHLGVTLKTVRERAPVVGPIPRRVCNTEEYERSKAMIDKAMVYNQDEIEKIILHGSSGVEADHHRDKPLSSIFGFYVLPDSNFKQVVVGFVSAYARRRLNLAAFRSLYNSIIRNTVNRKSMELGRIFEDLVFKFVEKSGLRFGVHPMEVQKGGTMVEPGTGMRERMYAMMKAMPMLEKGSSKSAFVGNNFPLIDFADARNRGFSITTSRHKIISPKAVLNLRLKLELQEGTVLHLVLVVPDGCAYPEVKAIDDVRWYKCAIPSPLTEPEKWEEVLASEKLEGVLASATMPTPGPAPAPANTLTPTPVYTNARGNAPRRSFSTLTCSVRVVPVARSTRFMGTFLSPTPLGRLLVNTIRRFR